MSENYIADTFYSLNDLLFTKKNNNKIEHFFMSHLTFQLRPMLSASLLFTCSKTYLES